MIRRGQGHATTRSTAGPGFAFEDQVGAWLLLKMLSGEAMPGMDGRLGIRLQSQSSALGWMIDDLLVTCGETPDESHLAVSCKSNAQVTSSGLPDDFVSAAWAQYANSAAGPMRHGDCLALVTRGHHDAFQATWADIKNACTGSDTALGVARIRKTRKHWTVFENVKNVAQQSSAAVRDEEVLEFIRHLLVIPTDFDLDPSHDRETAISQCRRALATAAPQDARELWESLVDSAKEARLGNGTIDLSHLWHKLRSRFKLNEHPDFSSGWFLLKAFTREHLEKIDAKLPSGYSLERAEDSSKLAQAIAGNPLTVLYGESGTGKSALAKLTLERLFPDVSQVWLGPDTLVATLSEVERIKTGFAHPLRATLTATAQTANILVLDAAERISGESTLQVRRGTCGSVCKAHDGVVRRLWWPLMRRGSENGAAT